MLGEYLLVAAALSVAVGAVLCFYAVFADRRRFAIAGVILVATNALLVGVGDREHPGRSVSLPLVHADGVPSYVIGTDGAWREVCWPESFASKFVAVRETVIVETFFTLPARSRRSYTIDGVSVPVRIIARSSGR